MSPRLSSALSIEYVLLALLDEKPMHGYELYQELGVLKGISLIWNIKQALLYAKLEKLEAIGYLISQLVHEETHPPRKYFHLTAAGKSSLETWVRSPVRRARDIRQEFLAKLIVAHRYGKKQVLDLIRTQTQTCQAWAADLDKNSPPADAQNIDEWFVHSFRVSRVQALLGWLGECEEEASRLKDSVEGAEARIGK